MSALYKIPTDRELREADERSIVEFGSQPMMLVEVDDWHPASDPPKPEDFKPTGWIEVLRPPDALRHIASNGSWRMDADEIWRKITPPKP